MGLSLLSVLFQRTVVGFLPLCLRHHVGFYGAARLCPGEKSIRACSGSSALPLLPALSSFHVTWGISGHRSPIFGLAACQSENCFSLRGEGAGLETGPGTVPLLPLRQQPPMAEGPPALDTEGRAPSIRPGKSRPSLLPG